MRFRKAHLILVIALLLFNILSFKMISQSTDWRFNCGKSSMNPKPALGKYIYIGNDEGILNALDPIKGKLVWNFNAGSALLQSPLIAENKVFLCTKNGDVIALDAENGNMKWKQEFRQKFQVTPVLYNEFLIVCSRDKLMGLDKEVGIDLWSTEVKISGTPKLTQINGVVYFSDDMFIYAYNAKNGEMLWKFETSIFGLSDICCANGLGYVVSGDRLLCIDLITGKEKWKKKFEYPSKPKFFNAPLVANNMLIVTYLSNVLAFDPQKGTEIWKYDTKSTNELHSAEFLNLLIWVAERGKNMYQITPEKGKKEKILLLDETIVSPPYFDKTRIFYINGEGFIISVKII